MKNILVFFLWTFFSVFDSSAQNKTPIYINDYNVIGGFNNGYAVVNILQNKIFYYGLIDKKGNEILSCKYDFVRGVNNKGQVIVKNKKYGMYSIKKEMLVPFSYEEGYFENNYGIFNNQQKFDIFNPDGRLLFSGDFYKIFSLNNGKFAAATINGKWHILDQGGNVLNELNYNQQQIWSYLGHNLLQFSDNDGLKGIIDLKGKQILPPTYIDIQPFQNGLAVCTGLGDLKNGLIDTLGNEILPCVYKYLDASYSEGYIVFKKEESSEFYKEWGFMDLHQKEILKIIKGKPEAFINGIARVQLDYEGNSILINKQNKILLKYKGCEFNDGLSQTIINGNSQIIDINGNIILKERISKRQRKIDNQILLPDVLPNN